MDDPLAPMRYVSTRGIAAEMPFDDVLLEGLATDGGLYVPERWPALATGAERSANGYVPLAVEVMWPFVAGAISRDDFGAIVHEAMATFDPPSDRDDRFVPIVDLGDGRFVAELFWGPTFAFKDVALQLVGRLFDHVLGRRDEHLTIVGATSGDTGSAAIEACRGRSSMDVVILHPAGRTSEIQRRQMTTVLDANVHNVAVDGTFDDCQRIVKQLFADDEFRRRRRLTAVNSINWARVMAQIVYHVWSADRVGGGGPVDIVVPTGNFGNVFAGHAARRMGAPIRRLAVASNCNDILTRFFRDGIMSTSSVTPTLSPSMDIQVSSNFERLLFELVGRDGDAVSRLMNDFASTGRMEVDQEVHAPLSDGWTAAAVDDDATVYEIARTFSATGYVADPHTAVGLSVARSLDGDVPVVVLGTAHPAKFSDAVTRAVGRPPELPPKLAELAVLPERCDELPNDVTAVKRFVDSHVGAK